MALPLTSDQPDRSVPPEAREIAREFLLARLGSLLAFAPLGVWVVVHLWHQRAAFTSPEAGEEAVEGDDNAASTGVVFVAVVVRRLWHTVWGTVRRFRSRP